METLELGRTGLTISRIGLGAMPLSLPGRPDRARARAVLHAALDAGVRLVDTANVYCLDANDLGHNERLIAEVLRERPDRDQVVVATKGGEDRATEDFDSRPEVLRAHCEGSLEALGVEAITLYQLHGPGRKVPLADSVAELARLREEGKIRHIGLSNVTRPQLEEALSIVRVESVQNPCNAFLKRDFRRGVIDLCQARGITYLAYFPVGGYKDHTKARDYPPLVELARGYGTSTYNILLAWLLQIRPHIVPIPGASRVESALASARAGETVLAPNHVDHLTFMPELM